MDSMECALRSQSIIDIIPNLLDLLYLRIVIFMDTAYGRSQIRRIGNWPNAFSCEVQALIRRISFVGYSSIDKGPFQMGTFQETLAEGNECALHLGPERSQVYSDLSPEDKERCSWKGHQNRGQGNNARGTGAAGHIARNCPQPKRPQNSEYFKDKMLFMQAQENGVALDEEQLLFIAGRQDKVVDEDVDEQPLQDLALNVDNVCQPDDYDAFDSDVDEAPTVQTMFMANPSSNPHTPTQPQDSSPKIAMSVQLNCIVDSDSDYMGDSNMILYDQFVKDSAKPVLQNNVSSVPNDAYMMIINEMHE
ncbi:hypothetical protein Tco_0366346 [Tanacetum coccineum]